MENLSEENLLVDYKVFLVESIPPGFIGELSFEAESYLTAVQIYVRAHFPYD